MRTYLLHTIMCVLYLGLTHCQQPAEEIEEALVDYNYIPSKHPKAIKVENELCGKIPIKNFAHWNIVERMKHYHIPGVSIALIHNFKIDWIQSYGYAAIKNREALTTKTLFGAGSLSKFITALAVSNLAQQNKLDLDQTVNSYLRSWKIPKLHDQADQITLRQLLSHTAGVNVKELNGYPLQTEIPTLLQLLKGEKPANTPPIQPLPQSKAAYQFASGGYTIVQQCLMDALQIDFGNLMNQQVFAPLKLTQATFQQPVPVQFGKTAKGYGLNNQEQQVVYPELAAKGLWTTPTDLATIVLEVMKALRGKSEVYSKEVADRLIEPIAKDVTQGFKKYNPDFWTSDYGLGIATVKRPEKTGAQYLTHGGERKGFSSKVMAHVKNGYGVVVMVNSDQATDFIAELIRAVALIYDWEDHLPYHTVNQSTNFRLKGYYNAKKVAIAGTFNHWKPDELFLTKGKEAWAIDLPLPKGKYMYKLIIDDTWILDPDNPLTEIDQNTENSLIEVR